MLFQKIAIARLDSNIDVDKKSKFIFEKISYFIEEGEKLILLHACLPYSQGLIKMLEEKFSIKSVKSHQICSNCNSNYNEGTGLAFIENKASEIEEGPVTVIAITDNYFIDYLPVYIMSMLHRCYTTRKSSSTGDVILMNLGSGISEFCAAN